MYLQARQTYIAHLCAFQSRLGLTNSKMAEILEIGSRTYERFIAGEPIQREFDLIMRVYELSGQMMYTMTGASVPREVENTQIYAQLTPQSQHIVDEVLKILYETERGAK